VIIPDRILEQLEFVSSYAEGCDDWVTVKKEVMRGIPSPMRKKFSTRDPSTKEQWLNNFEKELINYYYRSTGIRLVLRTLEERREMMNGI